MTKKFKLPESRSTEVLGFELVFQNVSIRGKEKSFAQVIVTEFGNGHNIKETYEFESWDKMKKEYPEMLDFLKELSNHENWFSSWRNYDRIYFIERSTGHGELYDMQETVWFDAKEEHKKQKENERKQQKDEKDKNRKNYWMNIRT